MRELAPRRRCEQNEKGGVVRRPFSKLRSRFLIAVSPQPGVVFAIGSLSGELESSAAMTPFHDATQRGTTSEALSTRSMGLRAG